MRVSGLLSDSELSDAKLKQETIEMAPEILNSPAASPRQSFVGENNDCEPEEEETNTEADAVLNAIRAENKFKSLTTICEEESAYSSCDTMSFKKINRGSIKFKAFRQNSNIYAESNTDDL